MGIHVEDPGHEKQGGHHGPGGDRARDGRPARGGVLLALEEELAVAGRRNGIRIFGPNTNTNAFEPIPEIPNLRGGKIGVVTQSGHNGRPIVQGAHFGIGFSRQIPCGNEADLDVCDFNRNLVVDFP